MVAEKDAVYGRWSADSHHSDRLAPDAVATAIVELRTYSVQFPFSTTPSFGSSTISSSRQMVRHNKKYVSANVMVRESLRTRNVEQNRRLRDGEQFNDGDFRKIR
jgi:hypothetical protein